jgi:hypothetical protein
MTTDSNDPKKIRGVSRNKGVDATKAVGEVEGTEQVSGIKGISRIRGVGNVSNVARVTLGNKERLLALVTEETNKLSKSGMIPASQRSVIEKAVKMVLEASIAEESQKKGAKG